MDIDPITGIPHIIYWDRVEEKLRHARWCPSSWVTLTVENTGEMKEYAYNSIAVIDNGNPAISFYGDSLHLARFDGSTWTTEAVETGVVGWYSSLAFDGDGNPHIAYYDHGYADLKYASWAPDWQFHTVDASTTNMLPSLALHNSDPGVAYQQYAGGASPLNFASWRNQALYKEFVGTVGYAFTGSSLKFTDSGHLGLDSLTQSTNKSSMLIGTAASGKPRQSPN